MKYDIVFANGCSFVQGSEVNGLALPSFPVEDVPNRFSKVVADHYNAIEVNLASGGSGNDRIFRTTFDWLNEQGEDLFDKRVLFLFGLAEHSRMELFSSVAKQYFKFNPNASEFFDDRYIRHRSTTRYKIREFAKVFWLNFYDMQQKIKDHYSLFTCLYSFIKTKVPKADIFTFNSMGHYPDWFKKGLDMDYPFYDNSWAEFCSITDRYDEGTAHPNKQAHKEMADYIINKYGG